MESESFFRYFVVSSLKAELLKGTSLPNAIDQILKISFHTSDGQIKHFSARTIYRWYKSFEQDGVNGLSNKKKRVQKRLRLSEQEMLFIKKVKKDDPLASVPEVIKQGILKNKLPQDISRTTVYRACQRMNLPLIKSVSKTQNMRRFSYPYRMAMVLCDGKHFRAGPTKQKRVVLIYIDDSTRFVLHHIVGTSETTKLFLTGLYELILKYGLMNAVYLDRGPGFKSHDTARVLSSLKISLCQGKSMYPEGHGKVEKFNQTIKKDLLRGLCKKTIDSNLNALTLRLGHYIEKIYNLSTHSSLNDKNPQDAFNENDYPLTFPKDLNDLKSKFVLEEKRKVSNDNIISSYGQSIELPSGYAGTKVVIYNHILIDELYIYHNGRKIFLHQVDTALNAITKREQPVKEVHAANEITLASEMAFENEMSSVIDNEGNFHKEDDKC